VRAERDMTLAERIRRGRKLAAAAGLVPKPKKPGAK
jgi:hypothetical protein